MSLFLKAHYVILTPIALCTLDKPSPSPDICNNFPLGNIPITSLSEKKIHDKTFLSPAPLLIFFMTIRSVVFSASLQRYANHISGGQWLFSSVLQPHLSIQQWMKIICTCSVCGGHVYQCLLCKQLFPKRDYTKSCLCTRLFSTTSVIFSCCLPHPLSWTLNLFKASSGTCLSDLHVFQ